MVAPSLPNLLALSVQIACIAVVAGAIVSLLRIRAAAVLYLYWRAVVAVCLCLPWLQTPKAIARGATAAGPGESVSTNLTAAVVSGTASASIDWLTIVALVLGTGAVLRLLWIGVGFVRVQRLRTIGEAIPARDHAELQALLGTSADIRYAPQVQQPITFGLRRPVILLPDAMRDRRAAIREAVLAHELLHVQRRDWLWVLLEESVRALLWFHPAMWWLISRQQLAREEVVDAMAVAVTGKRREYVEALLAFADAQPLAPASAFARRRHLFRRIVLISTEDSMSARRVIAWSLVMAVVVAAGTAAAVTAFPLQRGSEALQHGPGPIEQAARVASPADPIPRRIEAAAPIYPAGAPGDATVSITLRTTVDEAGHVAEVRLFGLELQLASQGFDVRMSGGENTLSQLEQFFKSSLRSGAAPAPVDANSFRPMAESFIDAAANAVRQWRYEPPSNGPIAFDVVVRFSRGTVSDRARMPLAAGADARGALRVGGSVKTPQKIVDARPVYPEEARAQRVQGVVIAEVYIQEDGRVGDARILRSIPLLDDAALTAIRQWEFTPTLLNGVPTPVIMTVTVQFSLE